MKELIKALFRKRATRNGGQQSIRCRVQNTGYKNAQVT